MDASFLRQAARAIGGRLRSALTQLAKNEAARAIRHFRGRMQAPDRGSESDPVRLGAPFPLEGPAEAGSSGAAPNQPEPAAAPIPAPSLPDPEPAHEAAGSQTGPDNRLDINAASKDDLKALKGIGAARADAILQGRPFKSPAELVERKILPAAVYEAIERRIRAD